MKSFKDLNIRPVDKGFSGDKIKLDKILNKLITVHDYRIVDSKFEGKGNGKCLHLQIAVANEMRVLFTGPTVLLETIPHVPKTELPFPTTIIKESESLAFT